MKSVFREWERENIEVVRNLMDLLSTPLPEEPARLDQMLREIDSHYAVVNCLYADAVSFYDRAKQAALVRRTQDTTDLDRDIIMRSNTSEERKAVIRLEGMVEALKSRLILGMALRKSYLAEGRTGHRMET